METWNALSKAKGHRLLKIESEMMLFDSDSNGGPPPMNIFFEGLPKIRLLGPPDENYLTVEVEDTGPVDVDAAGRFELMDYRGMPIPDAGLDNGLKAAWLIAGPEGDQVMGIRLDLGGLSHVVIYRYGEEIRIAESCPELEHKFGKLIEEPVE